jgi:cytoskeletal protein RodZ
MDDSVGLKLKQAREAKELSLEQISKELHIRVQYLRALEEDSIEFIPTSVQARGFLRSYSSYLGLSRLDLPEGLLPTEKSVPLSDQIKRLNIQREASQQPDSSARLFSEISEKLKTRREVLGLSKEDVEAHTHIPTHYVTFMEDAEFDQFPSPAQARGMLTNYLSFLDIPPDEIMLKYAEALQFDLRARQAVQSADQETRSQSRRSLRFALPRMPRWVRTFFSPDLILVTSLGLIVVLVTIWGIGRVTRTQSELEPPPTAPSLVEALLPTATPAPSPTATLSNPQAGGLVDVDTEAQENTAIPTLQVAESSSIQLFIIIRNRTYIKVTVDGSVEYDGRALPNDTLTFSGRETIELLTGNAAGLQVIYNNQDLGTLGIFGEVVKIIYTREGVIRPTAVPTATLSQEELATPTPTPTPDEGPSLPPQESTPIP